MPTAPDVVDAPREPRPVEPLEYATDDAGDPARPLLTALLAAVLLSGGARVFGAVGGAAQMALMVGSYPGSAVGGLGAVRVSLISTGLTSAVVALGLTPVVIVSAAALLGRPVRRWVQPACAAAIGVIVLQAVATVLVNGFVLGRAGVAGAATFFGATRWALVSAGQLVGVVSGAALPAALWWAAGRPSVAAMLSVDRQRGGAGAGGRLARR